MDKPYLELVDRIKDAVRRRALSVPKFRDTGNGAIRILAYPCCEEADKWFGGLSIFDETIVGADGIPKKRNDIVDYEHTFAISAGGSRVVKDIKDGVKKTIDCYAFSAMKIAHCSHAQDIGAGLVSGFNLYDQSLTEENGYGPYRGALCVEIKRSVIFQDVYGQGRICKEHFCGIYVSVSGADPKDDARCASVAVEVIKDFFESESEKFEIYAPRVYS